MILVCLFILFKDSRIIIWIGLFLNIIYFFNEKKNLEDLKGGCLFVEKNKILGVYDFIIFNFKL